MDYDRKGTNEELGEGDITGRITLTNSGRYKWGSDENAFYVGGTKFSKPLEQDYKGNIITTEQGEENRRYKIFDRTMRFCIGALAAATLALGITGVYNIYDHYMNKNPKTNTQIIQQLENKKTLEFVTPKYILEKQTEQIRDMMDSHRILLEEGNIQGTTIEDIIE